MSRRLAAVVAGLAALGAGPGGHPLAQLDSPPAETTIGPIPGGGRAPEPRGNPFAGDAAAGGVGRQLFVVYNCSGCHGSHGGGGMGPSLRDEAWLYGGDDEDVFDSIAQGRANGMPAWGTLLTGHHIWLLTTYVQSLRTPDEPDPPTP